MKLTDEQIQSFLINGFIKIQTNLPEHFHQTIYEKVTEAFKDGNPGNNIYPCIKELGNVFKDANVNGAIQSILGEKYFMQPHRYTHVSGNKDQSWHRDSFFGFLKEMRYHQPWNLMAFYYPQNTTTKMGPTAIKPKTQYDAIDPMRCPSHIQNINNFTSPDDVLFECEMGTVLLVHYDIVHRGTRCLSKKDVKRFLFKFLFSRLDFPSSPSWNHNPCTELWDAKNVGPLQPIIRSMWDWMLGKPVRLVPLCDDAYMQCINDLKSQAERGRQRAAYMLSCSGVYDILIDILSSNCESIYKIEATYALCSCPGEQVVCKLCKVLEEKIQQSDCFYFIYVLGSFGERARQATDLILKIGADCQCPTIKRYCCESLCSICPEANDAILNFLKDVLLNCRDVVPESNKLKDRNSPYPHARYVAALCLFRLGVNASPIVDSIIYAMLNDCNRYVNGFCLLSLQSMNTHDSKVAVEEYLNKTKGFCLKTNKRSTF
ncbi:mitochondrial import inner membrane translocase subunit TIM50 [Acrasis kona]|uniref:Mitochondrial import inner membrane translocase subunit TIM50 n=1 Tax=Acrasis kona TaxID=1008807 RepID=A0AAW2Z1C6_9EUKA